MIIQAAQRENVSDKVNINLFIHIFWLDALAEFAISVRLRRGFRRMVRIDDEVWYVNPAGDLVISASIEPETICMVIPRGLWNWL
jgi:hypothetical protein